MNLSMLKGLDEGGKRQLEGEFHSSVLLRQQIVRFAEDEIKSIQTAMRDVTQYEKSSWAMYQADRMGQLRAYEKIISLFS